MANDEKDFLTTQELAALLRITPRKVYDLVADGEIPCSRATGKLLFPRAAVHAWLAQHSSGPVPHAAAAAGERPNVLLGSHDPLLDWALKESACGIASLFDGSFDGLDRFALREGLAAGLHIRDPDTGRWNSAAVAARFAREPVVLIEWAWRERGLILSPAAAREVRGIGDLAGRTLVPRQAGAASQTLLLQLLAEAGVGERVQYAAPVRTENETALAVAQGKADAAFGLQAAARQHGLDFMPLMRERFDLLVGRRAWFEPPMQRLIVFCRSAPFARRAEEFGGYDIAGFGAVHFNGA